MIQYFSWAFVLFITESYTTPFTPTIRSYSTVLSPELLIASGWTFKITSCRVRYIWRSSRINRTMCVASCRGVRPSICETSTATRRSIWRATDCASSASSRSPHISVALTSRKCHTRCRSRECRRTWICLTIPVRISLNFLIYYLLCFFLVRLVKVCS